MKICVDDDRVLESADQLDALEVEINRLQILIEELYEIDCMVYLEKANILCEFKEKTECLVEINRNQKVFLQELVTGVKNLRFQMAIESDEAEHILKGMVEE